MRIDVISIFPDYLEPLRLSLVGKAIEAGIVSLGVHDLRDWTYDRHRTTDDTPYGGGAGMIMRPEPWGDALDAVASAESRLVLLSPAGRPFTQAVAYELAAEQHLVLACGRYEGIDARVAQDAARRMPVTELSIGDYVLTGGEAAALVVIEAVVRLLPGVLGNPASLAVESYSAGHDGLLEGPVYTKPPLWRGLEVPPVLISGHHAKIDAWRRKQALEQTRRLRPDLLPDDLDGLVISYAQPPDAGELLTLQRGAFVAEGRLNGSFEIPPLTEDLAGMEASLATGTVLIARLRGRLIASVRGEERPNRRWYVGRLMVAPDRLRQGIGSVMMEAIEALAPPGTEAISLLTGAASVATLGYYRRRGYVDVERVDTAEGVPVVIMERRVEP